MYFSLLYSNNYDFSLHKTTKKNKGPFCGLVLGQVKVFQTFIEYP